MPELINQNAVNYEAALLTYLMFKYSTLRTKLRCSDVSIIDDGMVNCAFCLHIPFYI
jgi:hypothetical protein